MRRISLFLTVFVLWLLLAGTVDLQHLLIGVLVAFITALVFGTRFLNTIPWLNPLRLFYLFLYILLFIWECIKANIDVAYRVLHPLMPIKPGIVKVTTNLKSDIAKTVLANSITMTPGTLSVDVEGQLLWIHWINVRSQKLEEASKIIVGRFENLLKKIFEP